VTARTSETQQAAKTDLEEAQRNTDRSVSELAVWPAPAQPDHVPTMFRSRHMFAAILAGHRSSVRVGAYFWDEVQ